MHIRYRSLLSEIYPIKRVSLKCHRKIFISERGGVGIVTSIVSFQILALIIMPIFVFCYQVILYDHTVDQLEHAAEIASFEIFVNLTADDYSEQASFENEDVSTIFKSYLFNALESHFNRDDFKNFYAVRSVNTLAIQYEYNYKDKFLQRDKWILCQVTYDLPINN